MSVGVNQSSVFGSEEADGGKEEMNRLYLTRVMMGL